MVRNEIYSNEILIFYKETIERVKNRITRILQIQLLDCKQYTIKT